MEVETIVNIEAVETSRDEITVAREPVKKYDKYIPGGSLAESQKRYYQRNKEKILNRHKERYENDPEYRAMIIARVKKSQRKAKGLPVQMT